MQLKDMRERDLIKLADLVWELILDEGDIKLAELHERIKQILEDSALLKR